MVRYSSACPESYDAYSDDALTAVANLRIRHGVFTVRCPDYAGVTVYRSEPRGDGIFADEQERAAELQHAVNAISRYLNKEPEPKLAEYTVEQE